MSLIRLVQLPADLCVFVRVSIYVFVSALISPSGFGWPSSSAWYCRERGTRYGTSSKSPVHTSL